MREEDEDEFSGQVLLLRRSRLISVKPRSDCRLDLEMRAEKRQRKR
jgi:hypothetical protein